MLKQIKKEHINMLHVALVAPLLVYAGWKGNESFSSDHDKIVFKVLMGVGIAVAVLHGWKLWNWYSGKKFSLVSLIGEDEAEEQNEQNE